MPGIVIQAKQHLPSALVLIPVMNKPKLGLQRNCPVCHIIHPVVTVHLSLSPNSSAIISEGVLRELMDDENGARVQFQRDFDIVGHVGAPPDLKIGGKGKAAKGRQQQDQEAYAQQMWGGVTDETVKANLEGEVALLEAKLAGAEESLAPVDEALSAKHHELEEIQQTLRDEIRALTAQRDPLRLEVMRLQDEIAERKATLGLVPPTIGRRS